MSKSPVVSVVIPVYNVETYLKRCVDSVLAQAYSNLDVVLVDDGATDSSGAICDGYAGRDARVRVLHQNNGGLSAARNAGMKLVRGEYVVFVDSDDCIGPEHIKRLLSCALRYDVPLAVTGYTPVEVDGPVDSREKEQVSERLIPLVEAMEYTVMLDGLFASHAWGKIYRSDLFDLLHYPVGKAYEDQYVTYKVIYKADGVAYENANDYYYTVDRKNSISHKDLTKNLDFLAALKEQFAFARVHCPGMMMSLETRYSDSLASLLTDLSQSDNASKQDFDDVYTELKKRRFKVLSGQIPVRRNCKIKYILTLLGEHGYRMIARIIL